MVDNQIQMPSELFIAIEVLAVTGSIIGAIVGVLTAVGKIQLLSENLCGSCNKWW